MKREPYRMHGGRNAGRERRTVSGSADAPPQQPSVFSVDMLHRREGPTLFCGFDVLTGDWEVVAGCGGDFASTWGGPLPRPILGAYSVRLQPSPAWDHLPLYDAHVPHQRLVACSLEFTRCGPTRSVNGWAFEPKSFTIPM
jgi:hypothetical protein